MRGSHPGSTLIRDITKLFMKSVPWYCDSYRKRRADTCWWLGWSSGWARRDGEIWPGRSHTTGPWSPLDSGTGSSWWSEPGRSHRYDMWWGRRGTGRNAKDLWPHPPPQPDWLDTWSERADVETQDEAFDSGQPCGRECSPALVCPPQVDAVQRTQAGFGTAGVRVAAGHDSSALQHSTELCALTIQRQRVTIQSYIPHTACMVKKNGNVMVKNAIELLDFVSVTVTFICKLQRALGLYNDCNFDHLVYFAIMTTWLCIISLLQ